MAAAANPTPVAALQDPAVRKHLRGSSLLLTGKGLAIGLNFLAQVLLVRYLMKQDYGAFAYALSVATFFHHVSTMGLRIGVPRFIPVYHERNQHGRLAGAILFAFAAAGLWSAALVTAVFLAPEQVARAVNGNSQPLTVLLILIFLVPIEAFDNLLVALFASFARARAIFVRRYLLGPGLRLIAVLTIVLAGGSVRSVAYGYVLAGLVGLLVYLPLLVAMLRQQGITSIGGRDFLAAARELFAFSLPLWGTDLLAGLGSFVAIVLLGYFHGLEQVAMYSVVLPLAHLNRIVRMSCDTLFTPTAARLVTRGERPALNQLYWDTAAWMMVLSFPLFVLTFSAARPLVRFVYGAAYEGSWVVLVLLAAAQFFITASGFNSVMLQVAGRVRLQVALDCGAAALLLVLNLALIPGYGAIGAAVAVCATYMIHTVAKQIVMHRVTGIALLEMRYAPVYALALLLALVAAAWTLIWPHNLLLIAALMVAIAGAPLLLSRQRLRVAHTFPELARIPLVRSLLT